MSEPTLPGYDTEGTGSLKPPTSSGSKQTLPPGTRIGPYEIKEHLAVGGMAHVYKVWHSGLHRHEAMKVPLTRLRHEPEFLRRFFQEARFAAKLQHPNIVGIHAVSDEFGGEDEGDAAEESYFTMELVEGNDLDHLLGERGRISLEDAIPILRGIADALDYAHDRGVVHRDMKPSNVLLQSSPGTQGGYLPKVSDFGIARAAAAEEEAMDGKTRPQRLTKAGAILGTPTYMSPEQAGSGAPIAAASDQYALAIMAYELLAGYTPFAWNPESPMSVILSHLRDEPPPVVGVGPSLAVDNAVNIVLRRALAKTPAERYPTCRAFIDALAQTPAAVATPPVTPAGPPAVDPNAVRPLVFGGSTTTTRTTPTPIVQPPVKTGGNGALIGVIAGIVVLGVAGAGFVLSHRGDNPTPTTTNPTPVSSAPVVTATPDLHAAEIQKHTAKATELLSSLNVQYRVLQGKMQRHQLSNTEAKAAIADLVPKAKALLSESDAALALDAKNKEALASRIDALIYLGRAKEARQQAMTALNIYPGDPALKQRLSFIDAGGAQ